MFKIFSFLLGISFVIFLGAAANNLNNRKPKVDLEYIQRTYPEYNINEENITRDYREDPVIQETVIQETYEQPRGRWAWAKVTAYTPGPESCGVYADGRTSIGVNTRSIDPDHIYGLAANPRDISYGTAIYIEGYWESLQNNRNAIPSRMTVVDDTGGAMRSFRPHWRTVEGQRVFVEYHIDVRYRTVRAARSWGVKYMPVFIYD
jgi:3D (Asp-Asp-Asp) domain-containing protein